MLLLLSVACICLCGIGGFWFLLAAGQVEQDTVSKFQSQKKTGKQRPGIRSSIFASYRHCYAQKRLWKRLLEWVNPKPYIALNPKTLKP